MVYIMQCGKYYKIGISTSPKRRVKDLQTANPQEIVLIATKEVRQGNDYMMEHKLHVELEEYRVRGEWFMVKKSKMDEIIMHNAFTTYPDVEIVQDESESYNLGFAEGKEDGYREGFHNGQKKQWDFYKKENDPKIVTPTAFCIGFIEGFYFSNKLMEEHFPAQNLGNYYSKMDLLTSAGKCFWEQNPMHKEQYNECKDVINQVLNWP